MKAAKLLALAMVAGLVLIASLGASTASATDTALCKTGSTSPYCTAENRYAKGTTIAATSNWVAIADESGIRINCTGSELKGETTSAPGESEAIAFKTSGWSLTGCTNAKSGASCTVKEMADNDSSVLAVTWKAGDDGVVSRTGEWESLGWSFDCGALKCNNLIVGQDEFNFAGGNPATMAIYGVHLGWGGGGCTDYDLLNETQLHGTFTVTTPSPLHVAKAEDPPVPSTGLCDSDEEGENWCAPENRYSKGTAITAEASNVTIKTTLSTLTCKFGTLSGELTATTGDPLLPLQMTGFSLHGCNYPGIGDCIATTDDLGTGGIRWIEGMPNSGWRGGVTWTFKCGSGYWYSCTLTISDASASDSMELTDGNPATLTMSGYTLGRQGESCSNENDMSANYTITSPKPVYVKRF